MEAKQATTGRKKTNEHDIDTTEARMENDGVDMVALHRTDDNGNCLCGTDSFTTGPCNVETDNAEAHWCEDCNEVAN